MDPFAASDADAWITGPFAIFELGGPMLAVGATIEEAKHNAERALARDLKWLRRFGEDRLMAGAIYVTPIDGGVAEMIRAGSKFVVPADATPEAPKLEKARPASSPPGVTTAEMESRFRLSIEKHFTGAEALGLLREDILGCLTTVTGETIALVSRGDAGEIGMHVGMVRSAAMRSRVRVAQAVARERAALEDLSRQARLERAP